MHIYYPNYAFQYKGNQEKIPCIGKLTYKLTHVRDNCTNCCSCLLMRISVELSSVILFYAAAIEMIALSIFSILAFLFGYNTKKIQKRIGNTLISAGFLFEIFIKNLYVNNLRDSLTFFGVTKRLAFAYACNEGNLQVIKNLKRHVDSHEFLGKHLLTHALYAQTSGCKELEPLLPLNNYEKEYLELKQLSHWLSLSGKDRLYERKLTYESFFSKSWFFKNLAETLQAFRQKTASSFLKISEEKLDLIKNALLRAYYEHSSKNIADQIRHNQISFLSAGYKTHDITLVFCKRNNKNYMAICNRGKRQETLQVYRYDPSLINKELIDEIRGYSRYGKRTEAKAYFYYVLPHKLLRTKDALYRLFKTIEPKQQKTGNCSLASKKAALRFAWAMVMDEKLSKQALEQARRETKLFTDWAGWYIYNKINPDSKFENLKEKKDLRFVARIYSVKKDLCYKVNRFFLKFRFLPYCPKLVKLPRITNYIAIGYLYLFDKKWFDKNESSPTLLKLFIK